MQDEIRRSTGFCDTLDIVMTSSVLVLIGGVAIVTRYSGGLITLGLTMAGAYWVIRILIVGALDLSARHDRSGARVLATSSVRVLIPLLLAVSLPLQLGRSWIVPVAYAAALANILLLGTAMRLLGSTRVSNRLVTEGKT